jgi:hypothetical protein
MFIFTFYYTNPVLLFAKVKIKERIGKIKLIHFVLLITPQK